MLCEVYHCEEHMSRPIPGFISCAGVTGRWRLLSHVHSATFSVQKAPLYHTVGNLPYGEKFSQGRSYHDFRNQSLARKNFFLQKCSADDELRKPSTMSSSRQRPTHFDKHNIASYYCFNVETHTEFPGRVVLSVHDIVGDVDCGLVAKLKIMKIFSWCVCW